MRISPNSCFRRTAAPAAFSPVTGRTAAPVTCRAGALIRFNGILAFSNPLAISWLVILRVVRSSNAVFRSWPWAHIIKESLKTLSPRSVHAYSFGPVPFVYSAVRIVAALLDLGPTSISARSFPVFRATAMRSQMRVVSLATAAFRDLLPQTPRGHLLLFPADASTKPHGSSFSVLHASVFKYLPRAKYLSSQINEFFSPHHPTLAYSV